MPENRANRDPSDNGSSRDAARAAGMCATAKSPGASDQAMRETLRRASQLGVSMRFLRLAAPRAFRSEVATGGSAFNLLVNSNSPVIEFILANPYSMSFLNRLDAEDKDNCEIRRVRNEVLNFALGLLTVREHRRRAVRGDLLVAFHCHELLWNLSIIGEQRVVVRAYHAASTGHDEGIADVHLCSGSDSRLAESFMSYWESVRNDPATYALTSRGDVDSPRLARLPSLFKGNAVWHDGSEGGSGAIYKVLRLKEAWGAEANWLATSDREARDPQFFRPVGLLQRNVALGKGCHGDFGLCLQAKHGVTAADLLYALQRIAGEDADLKHIITVMVSCICGQALKALEQFRDTWSELGCAELPTDRYPWIDKLVSGLKEAGRFVTRDESLLSDCQQELEVLGSHLEQRSDTPFRDAHLKNRIVCVDPAVISKGGDELRKWILQIASKSMGTWLSANTYDIDFETSCWRVPEWDDLIHVLSSPNVGLYPTGKLDVEQVPDILPLVVEWYKRPKDADSMRATLLCRSFRELCRRIWYSNVMPKTYHQRYRTEKTHHFLNLAQGAAKLLKGCKRISVFLARCSLNVDSILQGTEADSCAEPVAADRRVYEKCGEPAKKPGPTGGGGPWVPPPIAGQPEAETMEASRTTVFNVNVERGDAVLQMAGGSNRYDRYEEVVGKCSLDRDTKKKLDEAREEIERLKLAQDKKDDVAERLRELIVEFGKPKRDRRVMQDVYRRIKDIAPTVADILKSATRMARFFTDG